MGNWYANVTVIGPRRDDIEKELTSLGIRSALSPTQGEVTAVAPDIVVADQDAYAHVARQISERLNCPALALTVADDSVLWYKLYRSGKFLDEYNSSPGFFDLRSTEIVPPQGGDAFKLCDAFGVPERAPEVGEILHADSDTLLLGSMLDSDIESADFLEAVQRFDDVNGAFESQRHEALAAALGISDELAFFS